MSAKSRFSPESAAALLEEEFAHEMASALGRLGRGLERALASLEAFDAQHPQGCAASERGARSRLVAQAGHALWLFIVQREACGLRDSRAVMRDYRVPSEVQHCAGAFPAKRSGA